MVTFASICSGIEAASAAWEPLGWRCLWLAEIDKAASGVLAYRYPHIPNLGDLITLPARMAAGEMPPPDILIGGTPCQAFSIAGLRGGMDDPRGALTMAFVRLADAIDERRRAMGLPPVIIVWENVPGVLNHKDNPFGCFLAALAGEDMPLVASGKRWTNAGLVSGPQRTIGWRILDAQYFGLAQRRRRLFVVASAGARFDPGTILFESQGVRRDIAPCRETGESTAHAIAGSLTGSGRGVDRPGDTRGQDPVIACELPAPTWWDGREISQTLDAVLYKGQTMPEKDRFPAVLHTTVTVSPTLRAGAVSTGGDRPPGTDVDTADSLIVVGARAYGGNDTRGPIDVATARNVHSGPHGRLDFESETFIVEPIAFDARQQDVIQYGQRASPLDTDGYSQAICFSSKDHGGDAMTECSPTLRASGHVRSHSNAGAPPAVCVTGTVTHTLRADGFDASEDGTGRGQPIVAYGFQPRIARNGRGDMGDISNALQAQSGQTGKGDAAPCVAILCFDTTQISSRHNYSNPKRGDPCHPPRAGGHPPAITFSIMPMNSGRDYVARPTEIAQPLMAGGPGGGNQGGDYLVTHLSVRRLLPVECERLQGFADGWTERGANAKVQADGPRYKQLGNSMPVPVIRWLGRRIAACL